MKTLPKPTGLRKPFLNTSLSVSLGLGVVTVPVQVDAMTNCAAVTEIPQAECDDLITLYNSTGGPNWTTIKTGQPWNVSNTPCEWGGVICDEGHIVSIGLGGMNLTGSLPNLSGLTQLQVLFLAHNQLTGPIPDLTGLKSLMVLVLINNQLSGEIPSLLVSQHNFRTLWLNNNSCLTTLDPTVIAFLDEKDPEWTTTQTKCSQYPAINQVFSVEDNSGAIADSTALFHAGISVNDGGFYLTHNHVKAFQDTITISGVIIPENEHKGKPADIVVVGFYTPDPDNEECEYREGSGYYMKAGNDWQKWNGNIKTLVSLDTVTLSELVMLTAPEDMLYQDQPAYTGRVCLNFGYRVHDSRCLPEEDNCCLQNDTNCTIVFNGETIKFSVRN